MVEFLPYKLTPRLYLNYIYSKGPKTLSFICSWIFFNHSLLQKFFGSSVSEGKVSTGEYATNHLLPKIVFKNWAKGWSCDVSTFWQTKRDYFRTLHWIKWKSHVTWVFANIHFRDQLLTSTLLLFLIYFYFSSVAQSCSTLCNPMNHSTLGLPVHHQLPEFTQTHVHRVSDAIQPSHPLLFPSLPSRNPSQLQGLFQWVNSSHEVAKVLEFQL